MHWAVVARRDYYPAPPESEIEQGSHFAPGFLHEVKAGHTGVRSAVGDEFCDVLGTDKDGLKVVAQGGGKCPVPG
jgi:hypothetical protein